MVKVKVRYYVGREVVLMSKTTRTKPSARNKTYRGHHFRPKGGPNISVKLARAAAYGRIDKAKERGQLPSEAAMEEVLRREFPDVTWLVEVAVHGYAVDFYCPEARLVIEVDGASHLRAQSQREDSLRDRRLARHGVATVRVGATEVRMESAVARIADAIRERRLA